MIEAKVSLWRKEGKNGPFYAGKAMGMDVLFFRSGEKKSENSPDATLIIKENTYKPDKKQQPVQQSVPVQQPSQPVVDSSDIPF